MMLGQPARIAVVGVAAMLAVVLIAGCDRKDSAGKQDEPNQAKRETSVTKEASTVPTSNPSEPEYIRVPLGEIEVPQGTPEGEWLEIGGYTPLLWCYRGGKRLVFEQAGPKVYLSIDGKPLSLAGIIVRSKEEALLLNQESKVTEQPLAVWVYGPNLYLLAMVPNPAKIASVHVWEFDAASSYKYEDAIISDLSPLERLSSLSSLSLRDCRNVRDIGAIKSLKDLTSLDISGCNVETISPLTHLTNLRALNLVGAFAPGLPSRYQEYAPLKSLRSLQSLRLDIRELTHDDYDLAELMSHLRSLTDLTIEFSVNLTLVKHLSSLRSLTVLGQVKDLQPLAGLKKLAKLRILGTEYPLDLSPIKGCVGLTEFYLRLTPSYTESSPTDLRPIGALKQLRVFSIETPQGIDNLSAIGDLPVLESLRIAADNVTDISALSGLGKLRSLDLSNNRRLKDISPLEELSALRSLRLVMCEELNDLLPLWQLKSLATLDCSETSVQDLAPLTDMGSLRRLRLDWCPVDDISPLSKLTQMTDLSLVRCPLTDLRPLSTMHGLVKLDLSWPVSPARHVRKPERWDIMMQVSSVKDVSPLAALRKLRHLNLYNCIQALNLKSLDLPALESLHLPSHITDEEFRVIVQRHRNLTELHILDNIPFPLRRRVPWKFSLQPLSKLTRLRTLILGEMNDLSPLWSLRSLTYLALPIQTPTSTEPLSALTQLRKLTLVWGQGEIDMSFTAHLFNLFELYVPVTRRSELTFLAPLMHRGVRLHGIPSSLDKKLRDLWRKELTDR